MCTAAWMTAKYNAYHYFPNSGVQARVRYFLFVYLDGSLRLCVFGALHLMAGSMIKSIASPLCCMPHSSPLQNHLIHLLFQLVCSLDILVSSGGDHSNPRTEFAADTSTLWKVLHGSSGAFFLPKLSHRQQVDNGLQGSVDFHTSFRAYLRHHEGETRRRSCCPHGRSGMEVTWPPLFMKKNIFYIFRVRCFLRQRSILNFICRDP